MKAIALVLFALPAFAQSRVPDALAVHWKTAGELTIEVAEGMPSEGYGFRPNPVEMSFGELIAHIATADQTFCGYASGLTPPALDPKIAEWAKDSGKVEVDKETALRFLRGAFAFCDKAVAAMTPARLDALSGPEARHRTGFEWLWAGFTHTAHHRGQAEVYLRLKGITPPTYKF